MIFTFQIRKITLRLVFIIPHGDSLDFGEFLDHFILIDFETMLTGKIRLSVNNYNSGLLLHLLETMLRVQQQRLEKILFIRR